jgi:DNA-directed RNA polymerase specialized sigma24 family protein
MMEAPMLRRNNTRQHGDAYATGSDFCRIFAENMQDLFLLAFLLTADPTQAEQCFVAGLDDCSQGNQVFKEWARAWARRVVIKNAIRLIAPVAEAPKTSVLHDGREQAREQNQAELRAEVSAILGMAAFERFAFVLSVLEGYKDVECALLLGCTRETVRAARADALQQIARSVETRNQGRANPSIVELPERERLATPA